jgi:hypothetical protein
MITLFWTPAGAGTNQRSQKLEIGENDQQADTAANRDKAAP